MATSPLGIGSRASRPKIASLSDETIQKVEFGWPIGMPYCRSLGNGLWEVRSDLTDGKIGRVIFCVVRARMVLLHGFIKKTQKTPDEDLELARRNKSKHERGIQ